MSENPKKLGMSRRTFLQLTAAGIAGAAAPSISAKGESAMRKSKQTAHTAAVFAYGYDQEPYALEPGPHLFIDWRYIMPGRVQWQTRDGKDAPLFAYTEIKDVVARPWQSPYGIRLVAQSPEKIGPIIPNDRDWEFMIGGYCSLHFDDGKYRLWYEVAPPGTDGKINLLCYAESTDGVNWAKPELGLVEFNGSKRNNIVIDGKLCPYKSFHGNSVFIDPTAPPKERFKVIYMAASAPDDVVARVKRERPESVSPVGERKKTVILIGSSPDGLHWKFWKDILMCHQSDTQTTVYYDTYLKRYVGYYRTLLMNRRAIGRSETKEITRWPIPETMLWTYPDDDPADDYYTNSKSLYPGTKTMHLMFPTIYKRRVDGCAVRIASSLDGRIWEWIPGGDIMECGPEGSWDAGCIFVGFGLTEIPGNRVVLPYGGYRMPHKYPRFGKIGAISLAAWKKERLVALEADEEGEFYTQPMTSPGNTLLLNYQAKRAGYVKVEVVDVKGRALEDCDPLMGDDFKAAVTWKGDSSLGVPPGNSVQFRFRLRKAKLFSFEIK